MFPGTSQRPPPQSSRDLPALLGKKPLPSLERLCRLFIAFRFCRLLTLQEANSQLVADKGLQPGLLPIRSLIYPLSICPAPVHPSFHAFIHPSVHLPNAPPLIHPPFYPSTLTTHSPSYPSTIHSVIQPASQLTHKHLFRTD